MAVQSGAALGVKGMQGFYWLVEGELAGCGRPGGGGRGTVGNGRSLDADLAWLQEQGIGSLLTLTESPLPADALAHFGFEWLHVPVPDLSPPTPEQLMQALSFIDTQRMRGRAVVVHCLVGQGRTGTVLAAYLIRAGATPEQAIAELRARCPGAVENPSQERALVAYATRRDWIL
jgi:atypical dual specificity phosphatase